MSKVFQNLYTVNLASILELPSNAVVVDNVVEEDAIVALTAVRTTEPQNHHTTTRTTRLVPKYAFTFYRFKIFKNMGLVPSSVPFLCILEIAGKRKRFGDSFRDTFHSAFRIPCCCQ